MRTSLFEKHDSYIWQYNFYLEVRCHYLTQFGHSNLCHFFGRSSSSNELFLKQMIYCWGRYPGELFLYPCNYGILRWCEGWTLSYHLDNCLGKLPSFAAYFKCVRSKLSFVCMLALRFRRCLLTEYNLGYPDCLWTEYNLGYPD